MKVGVNAPVSIPSLSECDPGLRPQEFNVLVLPEEVEERTKGGIILPDAVKDADKQASQRGRLIAVSPVAFDFATFPENTRPNVGDVVIFAKYAGSLVDGRDGRKYRVMKDRDLVAVEESARDVSSDHTHGFGVELQENAA